MNKKDALHVDMEDLELALVADNWSEDDLRNENFHQTEEISPGLTFHYGVDNGKVYGYLHQEGLEHTLAHCKHIRDNEASSSKTARLQESLGEEYLLPQILVEALRVRGLPMDDIVQSGDPVAWLEVDKIIEQEYPGFKLTNRKVWREPTKKQLFKP